MWLEHISHVIFSNQFNSTHTDKPITKFTKNKGSWFLDCSSTTCEKALVCRDLSLPNMKSSWMRFPAVTSLCS